MEDLQTHGDERKLWFLCATAVVNLFAIKPIAVLVAVCFVGQYREAKSYLGQGRDMDLKFKQNNHKSIRLLAFGCLYSSGRQPENLLSRYMLSILSRILRYFKKAVNQF